MLLWCLAYPARGPVTARQNMEDVVFVEQLRTCSHERGFLLLCDVCSVEDNRDLLNLPDVRSSAQSPGSDRSSRQRFHASETEDQSRSKHSGKEVSDPQLILNVSFQQLVLVFLT
ncbi:hypothetical protein DNTS_007216 [Danionella cerebrum]|uniref:Uncharacterized protein n=1 Tax=Danionella cerebrum TaxID=2873325 RepID=A0A553PIS7_9TELE|nr:hypothetical protein DNTS_007216 [Danionella translucida]